MYVGGFGVQKEMAYHPGHTWAAPEGPERVRVGVDDFARRLVGDIRDVELPSVGDRVVQGQKGWTLLGNGHRAPLLSPVTGRVVDVNPLVEDRPEVVRSDPYGKGWLMVVRTNSLRVNLNNLLMGDLVRRWMEDTCARLRSWSTGGLSLSFADGGTAVEDLSAGLADAEWGDLVREFLLTDPEL
jgi:glycine cleavage system H protein